MGKRDKKIIDLVLAKKALIGGDIDEAEKNRKLAVKAIIGGPGSTDWMTYMKQFVSNDDPDQLMRLAGIDGHVPTNENRAYLIANGVCGEGTKERFEENVASIDQGLEPNCNPTPQ